VNAEANLCYKTAMTEHNDDYLIRPDPNDPRLT
jgi:hypothetical protein